MLVEFSSRDFLSLLGRLVSMLEMVPLGSLRYRPLQLYLLAHWRPSRGWLTDRIPLDHPFLDPYRVVDQAIQYSSGVAPSGAWPQMAMARGPIVVASQ